MYNGPHVSEFKKVLALFEAWQSAFKVPERRKIGGSEKTASSALFRKRQVLFPRRNKLYHQIRCNDGRRPSRVVRHA